MVTTHRLVIGDARDLSPIADGSVQLIVTSPPYPMIGMWDPTFAALSPQSVALLQAGEGMAAFEEMHRVLDSVWVECARVLQPGGFACINIGDATRTVAGRFALYPNHARISVALQRLGLTPLPDILWRKPTNAPTKFMGSGMLPAGAYVTYEHEYVLVFRKGGKRRFTAAEKRIRARSAFFWEERNLWFSDLWSDLVGARQGLGERTARDRSGAFPLELPYRLIQMYSMQGDTVLDPFVGTGTTMAAALASGRSSLGVERDPELAAGVLRSLADSVAEGRQRASRRLRDHLAFVADREAAGKAFRHTSRPYGFPVMTRQEVDLELFVPAQIEHTTAGVVADHAPAAAPAPDAPAHDTPRDPANDDARPSRREPERRNQTLPLPGLFEP
ncbi:MAG: site-specific DNA-methyltransferase [Deltaproteobacteria bacterium]|nr:MAG: site-specific DNA-methyltransferase [Deltaproteobacteria bacterium]